MAAVSIGIGMATVVAAPAQALPKTGEGIRASCTGEGGRFSVDRFGNDIINYFCDFKIAQTGSEMREVYSKWGSYEGRLYRKRGWKGWHTNEDDCKTNC